MKFIVLILVGSLGLIACAPPQSSSDAEPAMEILGRAFTEQPPNRARFSVEFEEKAEASEAAAARVVERANRATEAVRLASGDTVRITSDLNVRPYYQQVRRRVREHEEQLVENVHPDALLGYVARVTVNVTVLEPEQAGTARGAALAAGPIQSSPMQFFLEPTAESQRLAFQAAIEDAHQRARLAAQATGAELGELMLLQEGTGPCLGSPSAAMGSYGQPTMARAAAAAPAPALSLRDATPQQLAEAAEHFALAADVQPQRVEARVCAVYALR